MLAAFSREKGHRPPPPAAHAEGQHSLHGRPTSGHPFPWGSPAPRGPHHTCGSWRPRCSHRHVSQHGTTLRSHGLQTAATSSVSSFRPLCSLGWAPWRVLQCCLWLDPPGHTADTSLAQAALRSPLCWVPARLPLQPSPPTRAFRRSRGRTRFSASPLISGRGICEYPCCAFLSRSWTRVVALPSILRICPGPPLLAASHSDLTGATRSPWWFFILRVFRCRKGKPVLLKIKDLTKGLAFCDSLENGNFAQGLRDVFTH